MAPRKIGANCQSGPSPGVAGVFVGKVQHAVMAAGGGIENDVAIFFVLRPLHAVVGNRLHGKHQFGVGVGLGRLGRMPARLRTNCRLARLDRRRSTAAAVHANRAAGTDDLFFRPVVLARPRLQS